MKLFPMLSSYQYASNSPIANIDLDGGESKYYSIEIFEIVNGKGKLIHANSRMIEEKNRERGWFVSGSLYRSPGKLGDGSLYTITSSTTRINEDGHQDIVIKNIGAIYVPLPQKELATSSIPLNIIVFGSGSNPNDGLGSKANPNAQTISINFEELQQLMEPIMISLPDKVPGKLKPSSLHDLVLSVGDLGLGKAIENLKEKRALESSDKILYDVFILVRQSSAGNRDSSKDLPLGKDSMMSPNENTKGKDNKSPDTIRNIIYPKKEINENAPKLFAFPTYYLRIMYQSTRKTTKKDN